MEKKHFRQILTGAVLLSMTLSLSLPAAYAAQPPAAGDAVVSTVQEADGTVYIANSEVPDPGDGTPDSQTPDGEDPSPDGTETPENPGEVPGDTPGDAEDPGDTPNENPGSAEDPGDTPNGNPGSAEDPGEVPGENPGENPEGPGAPEGTDPALPGEPGPSGGEDPSGPEGPGEPQQPTVPADNPRRLTSTVPVTAGSLALEQSHVPYMIGMGDGTFHPDEELTRAEAIQLLARLITTQPAATLPLPYTDAVPGAWYYDAVEKMYSLGILPATAQLWPEDIITRAEFTDLMVLVTQAAGLAPIPEQPLFPMTEFSWDTSGSEGTEETQPVFPDVPADHWAEERISIAAEKGWITGYPTGLFGPDDSLTRCEICAVINRVTQRTGDAEHGIWMLALGLFRDVKPSHWAASYIAEAAISHTPNGSPETWSNVNMNQIPANTLGFHEFNGKLAYFDRAGKLMVNRTLGAYTIDTWGVATRTSPSYQLTYVPYISQIDKIYAWVGCEPVSALMGLKARGFATDVDVTAFLAALPTTTSNPEKGFVGSPYKPDKAKKTRTTIYPAKLAEYCNTYTNGQKLCADFRGASLEELQRELLAGNPVVCYMTLWWAKPYYRNYSIEGQTQRLVSNNHALLVYGYDPEKGYLCSDPYNYYNRGKVHQYWEPAKVFEPIWNERKVGMVIR